MRNRFLLLLAIGLLCNYPAIAQVELRIRSDYESGVRAFERGDLKMAIIFFRQGVEKGDPKAEFALGTHYAFGDGIEADLDKARGLFESSAKKDFAPSFTMLGVMHQKGKGVPTDHGKAVDYLKKAAFLCDGQAQILLAQALYKGEGAAPSKPEAYAWLLLASEGGEKEAKQDIEDLGRQLSAPEREKGREIYSAHKAQVRCAK